LRSGCRDRYPHLGLAHSVTVGPEVLRFWPGALRVGVVRAAVRGPAGPGAASRPGGLALGPLWGEFRDAASTRRLTGRLSGPMSCWLGTCRRPGRPGPIPMLGQARWQPAPPRRTGGKCPLIGKKLSRMALSRNSRSRTSRYINYFIGLFLPNKIVNHNLIFP
jgi:hypothetical protein